MSTVSFQDIVRGWSRKEINVSTLYKNEETGYCIQTIIDEETEDYIRLFKDNKTIAVKRKLLDDYSDWCTLMNLDIRKEKYRYEYQLTSILHSNYGISLDDFFKLVNEKYEAVPYYDVTSIYERISAQKLYCVIETDNYNSDYPNEHFIGFINHEGKSQCLEFNTKEAALVIANSFNQIQYNGCNRFFRVVEKNYKLSGPFEP